MVLGTAGAFQKHLIGARDRNRTCDLRVTSALLYRLSYTGSGLNLALTVKPGNFTMRLLFMQAKKMPRSVHCEAFFMTMKPSGVAGD